MKHSNKDEKILAALIAYPTIRAAASACQLSETQIYARLKDPAFKWRYEKARLEMLEESTAALQKHIGAAVEEMGKIATSHTGVTPQVRLNACEAIIRNSLKLTEQVEILRRLEALEAAQKGGSNDY